LAESEFLPVINLSGFHDNSKDRVHEYDKIKNNQNYKISKSDVLKVNLPDINNDGKIKIFV